MHTLSEPVVAPLRMLDITAADAARHPDALRLMFDNQLDGLLVRGLFSPDLMARVCGRIDSGFVPRRLMGDQAIVGMADELDDYFADAAMQSARIRSLFMGRVDFETSISAILSDLCGGVPVQTASGAQGQACPFATVRVLPHGAEIGAHVDNSFLHMPRAHHLHRLVDTRDQLSYFVPLSVPKAGGELLVYSLEWAAARLFMPDVAQASASVWLEGSEVFDEVTQFPATVFSPGVGDLLLFDGGRHFHRVSKVIGSMPRRTIGGFIGQSKQHDSLYVWS